MVIIHRGRMGRKPSGGRYHPVGRKRIYEKGSFPTLTAIGKRKVHTAKTKSSWHKTKVLVAEKANLYDPKTKTFSQALIKTVTDNPANRHYVRRNVITKGSIIDTDKGKARVTSRPGQNGSVNAILI